MTPQNFLLLFLKLRFKFGRGTAFSKCNKLTNGQTNKKTDILGDHPFRCPKGHTNDAITLKNVFELVEEVKTTRFFKKNNRKLPFNKCIIVSQFLNK